MKVVTVVVLLTGVTLAVLAAPPADTSILKVFESKESANILISFKAANTAAVRNTASTLSFAGRTQRIQYLHDALKRHADETQQNILELLSNHQTASTTKVRQIWVTNQLFVKNVQKPLIEELLKREEVSAINEERIFRLEEPIDKVEHPVDYRPTANEQWGLVAINAPSVWDLGYKGKGITIANIDSGVRGTHEALVDGFRSENGWYDAQDEVEKPTDDYGHGTHTMGTMVGRTNGIGVAPEAQWIACRACTDFCTDAQFLLCGQWALCPTDNKYENPRCDLAPHVISNSWGGGQDDPWYDDVMATWITAGIPPIFSQGNSGPSCNTANSPGDSKLSIGVGSTTSNNAVSSFSSVGPAGAGIKPDIAAPGSSVYSAYRTNDRSYTTMSGTSMASPHVAGLVGLLYNVNGNLTVTQIREILTGGAKPVTGSGKTCGGIHDSIYPNNHVGAGIVSATGSVDIINRMMQ